MSNDAKKFRDIEDIDEILKNIFYDESSKSCLRMRIDRSSLKAGDETGSLNKGSGYYEITVNKKRYLVHRLVMKIHGFCIKDKMVDHISGIKSDNRISNLRLVDCATNQRNRKLDIRNNTGLSGVRRIEIPNGTKTKNNYYFEAGYYGECGKYFRKKFSIEKYGEDVAYKMASDWRNSSIEELNKILKEKSYTSRHTKGIE